MWGGYARLHEVSRPDSLIQATTGSYQFTIDIATDPSRRDLPSAAPPSGGTIYYPHDGRTTALFFDGRVRMLECPIPEYFVNPAALYGSGPSIDL